MCIPHISHSVPRWFTIQTKHLVLLAIKVSTYMYTVMGKSALLSHMKDKKHEEYVKNLQGNEKTTKT